MSEATDKAMFERLEELRKKGGYWPIRVRLGLDTGQTFIGSIERLSPEAVTVCDNSKGTLQAPATVRIPCINSIEELPR